LWARKLVDIYGCGGAWKRRRPWSLLGEVKPRLLLNSPLVGVLEQTQNNPQIEYNGSEGDVTLHPHICENKLA